MNAKTYLTPTDISRLLRVQRDQVTAWIKAGDLYAINVGTDGRPRYRVDPIDFDFFKTGRSNLAARPVVAKLPKLSNRSSERRKKRLAGRGNK